MAEIGLAMNGYPHVVNRGTSCLAAPYRFFASPVVARQPTSLEVTASHHHDSFNQHSRLVAGAPNMDFQLRPLQSCMMSTLHRSTAVHNGKGSAVPVSHNAQMKKIRVLDASSLPRPAMSSHAFGPYIHFAFHPVAHTFGLLSPTGGQRYGTQAILLVSSKRSGQSSLDLSQDTPSCLLFGRLQARAA
jgi:hypothetical protein